MLLLSLARSAEDVVAVSGGVTADGDEEEEASRRGMLF